MARFVTALALVAAASCTTAFCPQPSFSRSQTRILAEIDFDAPVLADPQSGTAVLDREPVVDDECYMGKEGDFGGCVDFDPPRLTRSMNAMDQLRSAPGWTLADDFDAPVLANPRYGTAVLDHEPIVDDECYMGKEGDATDCVDFDPPRVTRSMNAMDQLRNTPGWTVADDFDAPVLANPQYGTTALDHEPIVDDECYMGKEGDATDCVDFDPPKRENEWTNYADKPRGERKGLSKLL